MEEKVLVPMTCDEILDEIKTKADKWNAATSVVEKATLEGEMKSLKKEYDETSMYTDYAKSLKDAHPLLWLAKRSTYKVVLIQAKEVTCIGKDGKKGKVPMKSVKMGTQDHKLDKYLEWLEDSNRDDVLHDHYGYPRKMNKFRQMVEAKWAKELNPNNDAINLDFSNNQFKEAFQDVLDALVFIPMEKYPDKNTLKSSWCIKSIFALGNKRTGRLRGQILPDDLWYALLMDMLYGLANNIKDVTYEFGTVVNLEKEGKKEYGNDFTACGPVVEKYVEPKPEAEPEKTETPVESKVETPKTTRRRSTKSK